MNTTCIEHSLEVSQKGNYWPGVLAVEGLVPQLNVGFLRNFVALFSYIVIIVR